MTPDELSQVAEKEKEARVGFENEVRVCVAAGCMSMKSDQVLASIKAEVEKRGMAGKCRVKGVGCLGLCSCGPLVSTASGCIFQGVKPEDAAEVVGQLGRKEATGRLALDADIPFFKRQQKIVLENSGLIDPERVEEYIAADGYDALARVLTTMRPHEVVEQVTRSGLRGRGGGGFPTGLKWATVAKAPGAEKYVICNADEGDPGAFMDRSVLESDPHRVIEGMAIAAYAVGARLGYIYVRVEYPLAVKRLRTAIRQAEASGLLGLNILGTTFNFHIELRLGAGAFVCGEETALIASVEGRRGLPRPRPPYPSERGVWGCPTLINNVETYANVAPILRNGGDWFASIGTEKSKGTKVFALAGKVKNTGLVEVPMGATLREIIMEVGGGVPGGRKLKAVQTGGPSGGCISEAQLDMPVDYDSLVKAGAVMGSGGMIVIDDSACMVDVARYFTEFCMSESCGKCIPCRVGTVHINGMLEKIASGEGTPDDLALLDELCDMVKNTSLCGLGQTSPNSVITTLRYFRDEYMAHIEKKACPAGVCRMGASAPAGADDAPVAGGGAGGRKS
jgi:bidirectional [NiFe] hydrogenase diaphorase subunit